MECLLSLKKWINNHPMLFINIWEGVILSLFVFATLLSSSENIYVGILVIVHVAFPWLIRLPFDDKKEVDKMFDKFLTGVVIAGFAILTTVFNLKLLKGNLVTNFPIEDLQFMGIFFSIQKLSMAFVNMRMRSKKYIKNYSNRGFAIKIQPKKTKNEETN